MNNQGLSSREVWTQRDQFNHDQLPLSDEQYIDQQYKNRLRNHRFEPSSLGHANKFIEGDLVYLYSDKDKSHSRPRYLVSSVDNEWCFLRKFVGKQLRQNAYKVHRDDCFKLNPADNRHPRHSTEKRRSSAQMCSPVDIQHVEVDTPTEDMRPSVESPAPEIPLEITELSQDQSPSGSSAPTDLAQPEDAVSLATLDPPTTVNVEAEPMSRPMRNRRPPQYLNDFIR